MRIKILLSTSSDAGHYNAFTNIDYSIIVEADYVDVDRPALGVYITGAELIKAGVDPKMIRENYKYMIGEYEVMEE